MDSSLGARSFDRVNSGMRMSTLYLKRLQTPDTATMNLNLVENDDDVDLQFVVEGEFFDGEEFNPVIETDE